MNQELARAIARNRNTNRQAIGNYLKDKKESKKPEAQYR